MAGRKIAGALDTLTAGGFHPVARITQDKRF